MGQDSIRRLLDEYEVLSELGRGGFSIVRQGKRKSGDAVSDVAIKTLRRSVPLPATARRRHVTVADALLTNEILVMRKIVEDVCPHDNVIQLYDVCEDAGGVHLILELCSGGELFDRIVKAQSTYSEVGAAAVVRQIACGLHALHRVGIVHRDLKPENCLFLNKSEDSPLKIMDFGLSWVENYTDPVVGLFGSIDYVSPEALSLSLHHKGTSTGGVEIEPYHQRGISSKSDMWSLGVILYILLSGHPPFLAQSLTQKQKMIIAGEFMFYEKSWKNISPSAKQLISSLLTVDPNKRPTAQEILQHPWVRGQLAKQERMDAEVVSRLQSFNARRKFRAAAIASVWSSSMFLRTKKLRSLVGHDYDLTPEELENLNLHFKKICIKEGEDKNNGATLSQFEKVLKAMEMTSLLPLAERIFDLFDNNRDGTVDMREILCGFSTLKNSQGDDALRLCFQMYDTDRSGCISKEEVASMLRALPEECLAVDITEPGKLEEIFEMMDANNDGKVTFDEFKAAVQVDITEPGKLEEIFEMMDANNDGKVTFDEFKAAVQVDRSLQDAVMSSLRPSQSFKLS